MNPTFRKKAEAAAEAAAAAAKAASSSSAADPDSDSDSAAPAAVDDGEAPKSKRITYHPELARYICKCIARGESLHRVASRPKMPHANTIAAWIMERPEFRKQYMLAKELAVNCIDEEIVDLADDVTRDVVALKNEKGESREVINAVAVQRSKTRIAARQWILVRLKPKKYKDGFDPDAVEAKAAPSPITLTEEKRLELIARRRAALERIRAKGGGAAQTWPPEGFEVDEASNETATREASDQS